MHNTSKKKYEHDLEAKRQHKHKPCLGAKRGWLFGVQEMGA